MRPNWFSFAERAVIVGCAVLVTSCGGCDKVPTIQDLTQHGNTAPASATPVDSAKQTPVQQPVAAAQTVPKVENPETVISEFANKPASHRTDQDLARLGNLSAGLDSFSIMDLNLATVTDDGLQHLAKLTNLETISLKATKVANSGLLAMVNLPKLTSINLANCTLTLPMMETLAKLETLETLSLESTNVSDNLLPPLANLHRLQELNLSSCPITDNGFKVLGTLKNLNILRVSLTSINGSGMQYMKRKRSEAGLRILDARKSRFGEQGLQYLKNVETLEELDVAAAEVSDLTLSLQLKGVSHLKKLNLSYNALSDKGTHILGTIKSLKELYLFNCPHVGDQTLFFLKANKELNVLDVNGCGAVTRTGAQSLKKFLPNCEIRFSDSKL